MESGDYLCDTCVTSAPAFDVALIRRLKCCESDCRFPFYCLFCEVLFLEINSRVSSEVKNFGPSCHDSVTSWDAAKTEVIKK